MHHSTAVQPAGVIRSLQVQVECAPMHSIKVYEICASIVTWMERIVLLKYLKI